MSKSTQNERVRWYEQVTDEVDDCAQALHDLLIATWSAMENRPPFNLFAVTVYAQAMLGHVESAAEAIDWIEFAWGFNEELNEVYNVVRRAGECWPFTDPAVLERLALRAGVAKAVTADVEDIEEDDEEIEPVSRPRRLKARRRRPVAVQ